MASMAEQLAANINFAAFSKATELKKRLWFALGCLIVYRFGTYIPLPGIDPVVMAQIFEQNAGGIMGMFNMFSGGALERMSIFALGILPYISASIIMQLMTAVSPTIEQLKKEGEVGRKKINQYTRYLTVRAGGLPGLRPVGRPRGDDRPVGQRRARSRLVLPHHHGDHDRRRHPVPDVARRADHRARRRQRHLA